MADFTSEQLNFFNLTTIVLDHFPEALRQTFKALWESRKYTSKLGSWDDSTAVRNMFLTNEGRKTTHVPTNRSYNEWDCTALFEATLYARSFAKPDGRGREKTLDELYVKPRRLPSGAFHFSVWSHTGNQDETFALALDQLRLLRNALCHQTSSQRIDNISFGHYLFFTEDALRALRFPIGSIENLKKVDGQHFHTSNIKELLGRLNKEKTAAIKSKQLEGYLSEIETLSQRCNTTISNDGQPKLNKYCGFTDPNVKETKHNGEGKDVKQDQRVKEKMEMFSKQKVILLGNCVRKFVSFFRGGQQTSATFEAELEATTESSPRCSFQEANPNPVCTNIRISGKLLETLEISDSGNVSEIILGKLEEAINFRQSEYTSDARNKVHELFNLIEKVDSRNFRNPTRYGLHVVNRGKDLFFYNSVSCSLKHGILLLDSSNGGAQFYASLLNILGVFALESSEFQIAKNIFSILVSFHSASDTTSRLRDMAAAFSNRGSLSLIMGELNQAESDFKNSLRHLNCEKLRQLSTSSTEAMIIGVQNNVCCLQFVSRNFGKCLVQQEELTNVCKCKVHELPIQTVFMVLHNQAMLNTTLGNMDKAEIELKWLTSYCKPLPKKELHDVLLEFALLQLCEVLFLSGKPEEAEKVYSLQHLTSECVLEMMPLFGGILFDIMIETFEKKIDVLVQTGKLRYAQECLHKQIIFVKERFGSNHFLVSSLLYKEGCTLKLAGQLYDSWEKLTCSAKTVTHIFGEKHPLLVKCYMALGEVSLRLGRKSESHLSFQRAMENVEVIHQVSFPNQLSIRYIEITSNPKQISFGSFQRRNMEEQMIEGLVAENGLALAVLISRLNFKKQQQRFRDTKKKGKKPLQGETAKAAQSETLLIISQKCARDLLLSGQTFLRLGMKNEAGAFFQLASELCQANHLAHGQCFPSLVSLYNVISQTSFVKQSKVKDNPELKRFLEELKEDTGNSAILIKDDAQSSTEKMKKLTLGSQMDLQLVLILLILFSAQLEMYDTIFDAYDLYASLFPSDGRFFLTANDELQVYSSRTSITCNGKTAVQYVLCSSAISGKENESECHLPRNPLFRSLVYRKGMPTYSLLAIFSSSSIQDLDELKQVEQATLRSFQEYLEIKCLDEEGDATQLLVDLSAATSEKETVLTSRRVELLPLCLSEENGKDEIFNERKDVHSIVPFLCEKIAWLSFTDKPTRCFMFGKISLWLLQECNWKKMSSLRVDNHCLVLTVLHPVKARITLWYEDTSIKQRVQIIITEEERKLSHVTGQKDSLCNSGVCSSVIEQFFAPAIYHWTNTCDGPRDASVITRECSWSTAPANTFQESCEPAEDFFGENLRSARNFLNATTLECLTAVSELTCLLYGDQLPEGAVQEEEEKVVVPKVTETDHFFSYSDQTVSFNQCDRDATPNSPGPSSVSNNCQQRTLIPEGDTAAINDSLLRSSDSAIAEGSDFVVVTDNAGLLGKELFEKDRKSRRLCIAKLQEELKESEIVPKLCPLIGSEGSLNEKIVGYRSPVAESLRQEIDRRRFKIDSEVCSKHEAVDGEVRDVEEGECCLKSCRNPQAFHENKVPCILHTTEEKKEQKEWVFPSAIKFDVIPHATREENPSGNNGTAMANTLPRAKDANHAQTEDSEVYTKGVCNKQTDQEMPLEEITRDKGVDIRKPEIDRTEKYIEDFTEIKPRKLSQSPDGNDLHAKVYKQDIEASGDETKNSFHGIMFSSASSKISETTELPVERTNGDVQRNLRVFKVESTSSRRNESHEQLGELSQNAAKTECGRVATIYSKDPMDMKFRSSFYGGDVLADGYTTDCFPHATDNADDLTLLHSEVHDKGQIKSSIRSWFQGDDVVADGYSTGVLPKTSVDVPDGPAVPAEDPGYPTIEQMDPENGFRVKTHLNDVKKINELDGVQNLDPVTYDRRDVVDITVNPLEDRKAVDSVTADFGGARPKQGLPKTASHPGAIPRPMQTISDQHCDETVFGLNPNFVARHAVTNEMFHKLDYDSAKWDDPLDHYRSEYYFSAKVPNNLKNNRSLRHIQHTHKSTSTMETEAFEGDDTVHGSVRSLDRNQATRCHEDESWYFPPLPENAGKQTQPPNCLGSDGSDYENFAIRQNLMQDRHRIFDHHMAQAFYPDMIAMTTEFNNRTDSHDETPFHLAYNSEANSNAVDERQQDLIGTRLDDLEKVMSKTVSLFASIGASEKKVKTQHKHMAKVSIQEQAIGGEDDNHIETAKEEYLRDQTTSLPRSERTADSEREDFTTPVQESPHPACGHYQRRCLVSFPCCGRFYPCHRCHNESSACTDDQARAINATHTRCTVCYHEQVISEGSQWCPGCNSKMSEYFCAICKHFTSLDKNPFHCNKCGICRIHRDKSFHCNVCNVCLDKRLEGKHKCRPDSGHDECCICLEDAFSGCQILPCSHKVHKDCAIAMIQNGVRTCPICRHPLFQQSEGTEQ